jgi:hypothetical protein
MSSGCRNALVLYLHAAMDDCFCCVFLARGCPGRFLRRWESASSSLRSLPAESIPAATHRSHHLVVGCCRGPTEIGSYRLGSRQGRDPHQPTRRETGRDDKRAGVRRAEKSLIRPPALLPADEGPGAAHHIMPPHAASGRLPPLGESSGATVLPPKYWVPVLQARPSGRLPLDDTDGLRGDLLAGVVLFSDQRRVRPTPSPSSVAHSTRDEPSQA